MFLPPSHGLRGEAGRSAEAAAETEAGEPGAELGCESARGSQPGLGRLLAGSFCFISVVCGPSLMDAKIVGCDHVMFACARLKFRYPYVNDYVFKCLKILDVFGNLIFAAFIHAHV